MATQTIHPSMKSIWPVYFLTVVFYIACLWAYVHFAGPDSENPQPWWLALVPLIAFLIPIRMHVQRNSVSLRFEEGDHLTIERGLFGKTRRTVDMAKIQDVTVRQSFGQRLMGVGDLVLESAGEAGSLGISNVDRPRELADTIIAGSKRSAGERARGGF